MWSEVPDSSTQARMASTTSGIPSSIRHEAWSPWSSSHLAKSPHSQKSKRTLPMGSGWRPSAGLMMVPTTGTPSER
eukprot:2843097-Alexandrium_andersonii.AAC.1